MDEHTHDNLIQEFTDFVNQPAPGESPAAQTTESNKKSKFIKGDSLMTTYYEPRTPVVRDLIVPGLTIFGGVPKIGKSFLMLDLSHCVSKGEPFLGRDVTPGDVLYLALEDSEIRLQQRSRALGHANSTPRLTFLLNAPTMQSGLWDVLKEWIKEASEPRLIIIDTLQYIRDNKGARNSYVLDCQELKPLKDFADNNKLAIVAVHHYSKPTRAQQLGGDVFDRFNGSNGLTGTVDGMIAMDGKRDGSNAVELYTRGRDFEDETIPLIRSGAKWVCTSPEAVAREKYERDPLVPIIRELKSEMFAGKPWRFASSDFAACANERAGKPLFANGREANQHLRALQADLLKFDGIHYEAKGCVRANSGHNTTGGVLFTC